MATRSKFVLGDACCGDDVRQARLAFGECSGPVESHRGQGAEVLQRRSALHQHAAVAGARHTAEDALGTEIASAQGLAATSTAIAR